MSGKLIDLDLSELSDVANALSLQGCEVSSDTTVLEVDNASERFIKKRANRCDWEVAGFGLNV